MQTWVLRWHVNHTSYQEFIQEVELAEVFGGEADTIHCSRLNTGQIGKRIRLKLQLRLGWENSRASTPCMKLCGYFKVWLHLFITSVMKVIWGGEPLLLDYVCMRSMCYYCGLSSPCPDNTDCIVRIQHYVVVSTMQVVTGAVNL